MRDVARWNPRAEQMAHGQEYRPHIVTGEPPAMVAWSSDQEGRALSWWLQQRRQPRLAKRLIQGLPVPAESR